MQGQPQTYRVTLSDGRAFDVTTEGGPPSEEDVYASLGVSSQPEAPEPAMHPHARVGRAGIDALKAGADVAWRASGIPAILQGDSPVGMSGAGGVVRDALMAQWDQAKKARTAFGQGRYSEAVGHGAAAVIPAAGPMAAHIGESIAEGRVPELVGELGAAVVMGGAKPAAFGARDAFKARRARRASAVVSGVDDSVLMAVPPSKTTPYTPADFRTAKPYINAQHERAPITSVTAFRDAADNAIGEIEGAVSGIVGAFPEAQLNPWAAVQKRVTEAFADNPRGAALQQGLKELDDLPLNADLALPELDAVRLQLNAENRAILKRNSYDVATARKADPGFAAREATATAIRDVLYDYLDTRGVKGVRELRRDEGALIKVRNAAERQTFSGARPVAGSAQPGVVREALGALMENAVPVPGIIAKPIASVIRGSRKTRDDLIARAFSVADDARPVYPTVPPRRPVAGELPPVPEVLGPIPDASGRINPTLPEHYTAVIPHSTRRGPQRTRRR